MGLDDEILRMAREADCLHVNLVGDRAKALERLQRFAALVIEDFLTRSGQCLTNDASLGAAISAAVAVEREACAKIGDSINAGTWAIEEYQDRIRERGSQ